MDKAGARRDVPLHKDVKYITKTLNIRTKVTREENNERKICT